MQRWRRIARIICTGSTGEPEKFSFWVAVCFAINVVIGSGFLAIPYGVSQAGLLLGVAAIAIAVWLCDISKDLLLDVMGRAEAICEGFIPCITDYMPGNAPQTYDKTSTMNDDGTQSVAIVQSTQLEQKGSMDRSQIHRDMFTSLASSVEIRPDSIGDITEGNQTPDPFGVSSVSYSSPLIRSVQNQGQQSPQTSLIDPTTCMEEITLTSPNSQSGQELHTQKDQDNVEKHSTTENQTRLHQNHAILTSNVSPTMNGTNLNNKYSNNNKTVSDPLTTQFHLSGTNGPMETSQATSQLISQPKHNFLVHERRFEISELCEIFIGPVAKYLYLFIFSIWVIGTLWSFSAVFSSDMAAVIPITFLPSPHNTTCAVDSGDGDCSYQYMSFLIIYAIIVIPLSLLDMEEQLILQVALAVGRVVVMLLMIGSVVAGIACDGVAFGNIGPNNHHSLFKTLFRSQGIAILVPLAITTAIMHHTIPSVSASTKDKTRLSAVFRYSFIIVGICYALIGAIISLYFGMDVAHAANVHWHSYYGCIPEPNGRLLDTSNMYGSRPVIAQIVSTIVLAFPPLDVLSVFPLAVIALANCLVSSVFPQSGLATNESNACVELSNEDPSVVCTTKEPSTIDIQTIDTRTFLGRGALFWRRVSRLCVSIPPLIGAAFEHDLGAILQVNGTIGIAVAMTIPALLWQFSLARVDYLRKQQHIDTSGATNTRNMPGTKDTTTRMPGAMDGTNMTGAKDMTNISVDMSNRRHDFGTVQGHEQIVSYQTANSTNHETISTCTNTISRIDLTNETTMSTTNDQTIQNTLSMADVTYNALDKTNSSMASDGQTSNTQLTTTETNEIVVPLSHNTTCSYGTMNDSTSLYGAMNDSTSGYNAMNNSSDTVMLMSGRKQPKSICCPRITATTIEQCVEVWFSTTPKRYTSRIRRIRTNCMAFWMIALCAGRVGSRKYKSPYSSWCTKFSTLPALFFIFSIVLYVVVVSLIAAA